MKGAIIQKIMLVLAALVVYPAVGLAQRTGISEHDSLPDMRIMLQTYKFDPLIQLPTIDKRLLLGETRGETIFRLVQFKGPLAQNQIELLKNQYKLKLDQYIPNYTYLEKINPEQLENLQKLPFFRWIGNYEPAYKISPEIGTVRYKTPERQGISGLWLRVVLFPGYDGSDVVERLRSIGSTEIEVLDYRKLNSNVRILFQIDDKNKLSGILQLQEVLKIEEIGETFDDNGTTTGTIQSGTPGITPVWDHGIHGEGQVIGILDGGPIDTASCYFRDPNDNTPGPNHRKVTGHRTAGASSYHATFVAGIAAGDNINNPGSDPDRGIAWAARFTGKRRNSSKMLENLYGSLTDGAIIHTNSWHDEPEEYSAVSSDVDNFLWNNEDDFLCGSSGNVGESIGPPGTAKNAMCVSASQRDPNEMNFGDGNSGPSKDGRRKPDIFAPGCNIRSVDNDGACGIAVHGCATSWATPAIAASAALVRQYYKEGWYPTGTKQPHNSFTPSGALIKATLLNSTLNMTGIAGYPGNLEGWGLVRLNNVLFFPGNVNNSWIWDIRNNDGLFTGVSRNYSVNVASNIAPLKITLVWTDPPQEALAADPIINDLDLVVTAPNGDVYRGNDFTNGQSTVNGAVTDNLNNVEMVLINTPQVGQYTIQIIGTEINEGNPGQGYALVATADTEDPPVPTGTQNTLVVRTGLSDISAGTPPSETNVMNLITAAGNYISEVSYGTTTINPQYVETTLSHPSSYYYHPSRNVLIEMAQEIITNLVNADPDIFTQGTPAANDDIARMVILTNDPNFIGDWATTGPWPYDLPDGLTRRISVSVNSVHNDAEKRIEHALCHQFGLVDLYAYPNVVFAQPHVDDWDIMANVLNNVHPMAWSKERAVWMSTFDPNSILYIPRPAVGGTVNQTVPLDLLSSTGTTHRKVVAIGLTPLAATLADEQVFYFIEARSNAEANKDSNVPESGVLLYYVNENIRQGEGPVRIIDDVVSTPSLTDAALEVGDTQSPGGTGITVTVQNGTGGAPYNVVISYTPPVTDNDVNIRRGDPAWTSPDIWVDSPKNGFDVESGRIPADRGDNPVMNEVNRIYFRIHNPGPGDAHDITVYVRVSEPYHTVGGAADFNVVAGQKFYALFASGTDITDYVEWTPDDDGDPHSCIWVNIPDVFNDINTYNNTAQQNTTEVSSSHSSPYETVVYHFSVTNPFDVPQLMYFQTEGIPQGWTSIVSPPNSLLNANQRIEGTLTVHPPDNAVPCTEHKIVLTTWMPRGNTLVKLGGGVLQVDLRNRTDITLETDVRICDEKRRSTNDNRSLTMAQGMHLVLPTCIYISAKGCTNPPQPNEEIIVRYEDPNGDPIYHTVLTDEYGCYSDTYLVAEGGDWEVNVEYPGSDCDGPAVETDDVFVPIEPTKEINIYAGYFRFNDEMPVKSNITFGLRFGYNFAYLIGVEGEIGITPTRDRNDVRGTVINANINVLKYAVSSNLKFWPYAVASTGKVWLIGFSNSTSYFSTAAGIGAKYYFTNHFALRAEAKAFLINKSVSQQYTVGLSYRF